MTKTEEYLVPAKCLHCSAWGNLCTATEKDPVRKSGSSKAIGLIMKQSNRSSKPSRI